VIPLLALLIKLAVSAGMVLTITLVAERASARFAGVLMGFPLGAGLSLFFIGVEQGPLFAADSALWSTQGILATLGFSWGYLLGLRWFEKEDVSGVVWCVVMGLTGYFVTALCVRYLLPESLVLRSLLLAAVLGGCIARFRAIPVKTIEVRVSLNPTLIAIRAGFAAMAILLITWMAGMVGPQWSGIFSTFPATVLPSVVVLHHHYGREAVKTLFREFPLGLLAVIIFALTVHLIYPGFGVYRGTLISYMIATVYLLVYEMKLRGMLNHWLPPAKATS
jgi:hypothetical protein